MKKLLFAIGLFAVGCTEEYPLNVITVNDLTTITVQNDVLNPRYDVVINVHYNDGYDTYLGGVWFGEEETFEIIPIRMKVSLYRRDTIQGCYEEYPFESRGVDTIKISDIILNATTHWTRTF